MRYELFLRIALLSDQTLETVRGEVAGELSVDSYRDPAGALAGFDLGVDADHPGGAQQLCAAAFQLAADHGLTIYDPQLGRTVAAGDEEEIRQQLAQTAAFAMSAPVTPMTEGQRLTPTLRLWLLVLGLVLGGLLLVRALSCAVR